MYSDEEKNMIESYIEINSNWGVSGQVRQTRAYLRAEKCVRGKGETEESRESGNKKTWSWE